MPPKLKRQKAQRQWLAGIEAMQEFAKKVSQRVQGGQAILLYGELGTGKTTFVQFLAQALGLKDAITSPTFTIVAHYKINTHPTIRQFVHGDLYRLSADAARHDPAIRDMLEEAIAPDQLIVIEWADRLIKPPWPQSWQVWFEHREKATERMVMWQEPS